MKAIVLHEMTERPERWPVRVYHCNRTMQRTYTAICVAEIGFQQLQLNVQSHGGTCYGWNYLLCKPIPVATMQWLEELAGNLRNAGQADAAERVQHLISEAEGGVR